MNSGGAPHYYQANCNQTMQFKAVPATALAPVPNSVTGKCWILDSGATDHITCYTLII